MGNQPFLKNKSSNQSLLLSILSFLLFFGWGQLSQAQEIEKTYLIGTQSINSFDKANLDSFPIEVIKNIAFDQINAVLEKKGLEPKTIHPLLQKAAQDQADYMAAIEDDQLVRKEKSKATTGDRIAFYGGSRMGAELSGKTAVKKGDVPYSYAKIVDDVVFRWFSAAKKADLLESIQYNLIGAGAAMDTTKKRVYLSVVLGNYKSFNEGANLTYNITLPYSTKNYGLQPFDPSKCKKVLKRENINELQKGISVEDNVIYFESADVKSLKKIISKYKDGLAVDLLQKKQFDCKRPNVVDHNQFTMGIISKRIYKSKLFKNNVANTQENPKAFKVALGLIPEVLEDDFELNLIIVQDKHQCASIAKNFIIQPTGTYKNNIKLLADTITINSRFQYKPATDSLDLTFKIPFENKKYTYEPADIEPFLKLLNEPAFIIYDLKITAYSSIEGTDKENRMLQQKRAESIVKSLEGLQNTIIKKEIVMDYNWDDFKKDISKSEIHAFDTMQLTEAQTYIRANKLNKKLEPILQNHRYARIDMKVAYDISGENETHFVIKKFNTAVDSMDRALALSIQKYIIKQILNYRYKPALLSELAIPQIEDYAGIEMNRLWLQHLTKQITTEYFDKKVEELTKLDPENEYIAFNDIFNKVANKPISDISEVIQLQTRIDRLYYTPLKKETIDGLNVKLQFKLINYIDSVVGDQKIKDACVERIKKIIDINEETMQNSLKIADIFIDYRDYTFALKSLEPWVANHKASENLIFSYISLCSQFEERMHTQKFEYAMQRAYKLNPQRYCDLFNGDYFSYKVFENNAVKEMYCGKCIQNKPKPEEE
jgi:hypothetical protein